MIYWKLDNQTIRCLINKEEISRMGFDLQAISTDAELMSEFLEAIVNDSHNYIDWNTDNGVQNYIANALPADQFLITITCTYPEDMINQDLKKIRRMIQALTSKISYERIDEVERLSGKDKEAAFIALSKDLKEVCSGDPSALEEIDDSKEDAPAGSNCIGTGIRKPDGISEGGPGDTEIPSQKITFGSMEEMMEFCSVLDAAYAYPSSLYRLKDEYILLVDFEGTEDEEAVVRFLISAEEYGAMCESSELSRYYILEHGERLIAEDAIGLLITMAG